MPLKLLAVGDMHLGKRPSRLPSELSTSSRDLGPSGTWKRVVNTAIDENVHAVLLAGDVVEHENDFFEAYRELHSGVSRLTNSGIRVLGVAGNHDVKVLPRLADKLPNFELLGKDGKWEHRELCNDNEKVTLWGWSFPSERVIESPLGGVKFDIKHGGPNIGVLHCDRDQPQSPYAPVSSRELFSTELDAWLLGHIHKPDSLTTTKPYGYLGSLIGTDSGEPGIHGPWCISISNGQIHEVKQWPLATLRWELLTVNVQEISVLEEARERLLESLQILDKQISSAGWVPNAVGLRVQFEGRTRFGNQLLKLLSDEDKEHIFDSTKGTHYFIERVKVETRPEISLAKLGKQNNPLGLLARRLLVLERPKEDEERKTLLAKARARLTKEAQNERWNILQPEMPNDVLIVETLKQVGFTALEQLLAQGEQR